MMKSNEIQFVDNEFYTAWYVPDYSMIRHVWHQHCKGETWRNIMTLAADAFVGHNCFKWLADDRKFLGAMTPEDWAWAEVNFAKRCREAGWKYFAMVLPDSGMAKVSIRAVCNAFSANGIETEAFTDYVKAYVWITTR